MLESMSNLSLILGVNRVIEYAHRRPATIPIRLEYAEMSKLFLIA